MKTPKEAFGQPNFENEKEATGFEKIVRNTVADHVSRVLGNI